jgi:hypothetical protein
MPEKNRTKIGQDGFVRELRVLLNNGPVWVKNLWGEKAENPLQFVTLPKMTQVEHYSARLQYSQSDIQWFAFCRYWDL